MNKLLRPALVLGRDKILLKLTSGKTLSLINALYVKNICYNLVSISIMGKSGVRVFFEGDKVVLSRNGLFVGKGYCSNGLSMVNLFNVIMNESVSSSFSSSTYIINSFDL